MLSVHPAEFSFQGILLFEPISDSFFVISAKDVHKIFIKLQKKCLPNLAVAA